MGSVNVKFQGKIVLTVILSLNMNVDERHLARIMFRLKVHESNGQAYENLFVSIMQKSCLDFTAVKPQGSIGDRKNDGYDRTNGNYYQVFAPEDPKLKRQDAVAKLKTDFAGLYEKWQKITPVKEFYFVFNDKYSGTFFTIEEDLKHIKETHSLNECAIFLAQHLEAKLFNLEDDQIFIVLGGRPPNPENIENLDYSILKEVINHILAHRPEVQPDTKLIAPNFRKKIQFNRLHRQVASLLTTASYQAGTLEAYFKRAGDYARQTLRDNISRYFQASQEKDFEDTEGISKNDLIFFDLAKTLAPNSDYATQQAVYVIMGYFFESCDIYEDPSAI